MTCRSLALSLSLAFGLATAPVASLLAANLFWDGTPATGNLTDANYFNLDLAATDQAPTAADALYIAAGGVVSHSVPGPIDFQRLRVGYNLQSGYNGQGTLTISNGAQLNLTEGGAGADNASIWVGNAQNATLNIDGAGSSVTATRLVIIGYGNNANRTATVNITGGGALVVNDGNINLGQRRGSNPGGGVPAQLNVSDGAVSVLGGGADLVVGSDSATSSVNQTGGLIQVADTIVVGAAGSTGSSYNISGGTTSTGSGSFFVGRGAVDAGSVNAALNISGDAVLNVGARLLVGTAPAGDPVGSVQAATGAVVNQTGGVVNTALDVRVGDANANNSTYNFSGGKINSITGGHVGRQGSAQFIQTGGVANFFGTLNIGNREAAVFENNSGLYKISDGEFSAGAGTGAVGLSIAFNGTGEFRVVGDDASVDVLGSLLVGNTAGGVGTLAFEFESGDQLSMIDVLDAATFSSGSRLVLDVTGAAPSQLSYDLLTAASIDDQGLVFEAPAGWTHQIVSGGNGQILRAVSSGIPADNADFDGDGDVDGRDLLAWQRGLGGAPTLANGNANGDGAVDAADLQVWRSQFGNGAATPAVAAVPEPGSMALLAAAFGMLAASVRRN